MEKLPLRSGKCVKVGERNRPEAVARLEECVR